MVKDGIFLGERYEVLSKLGAGGMADVYKGKDCMLNRYVAIKVLKKEYREDEEFVKKFRSEAQAAAGLMNPNIVNVYDVGEDRGLYYMVMELVEGITLKEYIQKKGRLSTNEAISISIQMCTGIEAAHRHHIIHRDIKPQNIIISKEGKVKVTDFGIARAVNSHTISSNAMGSVHYVSPEQARGGFCDMKSDIYSAGITMYEMVTGRVPFDGDSTVAVAMKHLQEIITPPSEFAPDMAPALEKIILKCTQKSPDRRYPDISLLIQDLKRALVDPEGDFVDMVPIRSVGDTVMISPEEMSRIKRGYEEDDEEYDDDYDDEYDDDYEYDDEQYDDEDDDEYDDDYDKRGKKKGKADNVNPSMNKMMKILTIVVAVIIVFVLIFIIGKAAGVFKFPGSNVEETVDGKVVVPKLVGEKETVAEQICEKKNLKMKVVKQQHSDQYAAGYVIEQKTEAGKKVKKKSVIEVVVSSGAEEVAVPDVSGMNEDQAKKALVDKGFESGNITTEFAYSDDVAEGEAVKTSPAAGEKATVDTKITLYISKGAEKKTVPNIVGQSVSDAQSALSAAGLADGGTVSEEYSDSVAEGVIISQNVKAGKKVDAGTSVGYTVSKGKKPADTVSIPSGLVGQPMDYVKKALRNVGLEPVEGGTRPGAQEYGIVVEISPGSGKVEVGSKVTIYISDGSQASGGGNEGENGNTQQ